MKANDKNVSLNLENLEERAVPASFYMSDLRETNKYARIDAAKAQAGLVQQHAAIPAGRQFAVAVQQANPQNFKYGADVYSQGKLWLPTNTTSWKEQTADNIFSSKTFKEQQVNEMQAFYDRQWQRVLRNS